MTEIKNIYQRCLEAKKTLAANPWRLENQNTMFKTISIDQMKEAIEKAHVEHGIIVQMGEVVEFTRERVGEKGNLYNYKGVVKFLWVNPDNPADKREVVSIGEAMDTGDKGVSKFCTNALKNMYKIEYNIAERGDDIDEVADPVAESLRVAKPAERTKAIVETTRKRVPLKEEN